MTTGNEPGEQPQRPGGPGHQPPRGGSGYPPPPPGAPQQPAASAQPSMRPDEEKLWAIGAHIGPIVLGFIAPLVVWLVYKDRSAFLDRHGKEALNMQLSYLVYFVVAGVSMFLLIGFLLLPVLVVAWLVLMIIATVKAANFEDFRYPLIFRFIG